MSNLEHSNIIKLKESYNTSKTYVIVMSLLTGGSLSNYIKNHSPVPEDKIRLIF